MSIPKNQVRTTNTITQAEHEDNLDAKRVVIINTDGNQVAIDNPIPVVLSDGSINIGTVNAEIETQLSRRDDFPDSGDVHDSVRIGNQTLEWGLFDLGGGFGAGRTYNENPLSDPVQSQLGNGANVIGTVDIGSETMLIVKKGEDPTFYMRVDEPSAGVTFIGKTYDLDAATSSGVWQIQRIVISGNETITQFADDEATYDKIWDDRASLFGAIPFANAKSLFFDGANDYLDIAHNALIDFDFRSEAASFSCWVKTSNTSGGKTYMEKQDSNVGWRFYLSSNRLTLELRGTGGLGDRIRVRSDNAGATGATLNDGNWHHICATYDGSGNASGVTLYLDGSSLALDIQNDTLSTDTSNTVNAAVGARSGGGNNFGAGFIDEPSIWDVELTPSEVSTVYNSGAPIDLQGQGVSPITASLNAWWRMGDGPSDSYPSIVDVENNIIGTMTNMTAGDIVGEVPI